MVVYYIKQDRLCYSFSNKRMTHIKEPLLLIGKCSPCGGCGLLSSYLSGPLPYWLTPYNRKLNVLNASLDKTFPSFLQ